MMIFPARSSVETTVHLEGESVCGSKLQVTVNSNLLSSLFSEISKQILGVADDK